MKITLGIIKTSKNLSKLDEVLEGINDNIENVHEIIYTGNEEDLEGADFEFKALNLDTDNKAVLRNAIIENAEGDYILWIDNFTVLEFDMLSDILEEMEDADDIDIFHPNVVYRDIYGNDIVKKGSDIYKKEKNILLTLSPEDFIPEFGILTKKETLEKLGKFDENYKDYEFYNFLYQNIEKLKLKFLEFNVILIYLINTFIDTSYRSKALREALKKHDLKEVFLNLSWKENENLALATAYTNIGDIIYKYHDLYNTSEYYRKALISFYNKHTLYKLILTYLNMGIFNEAKNMVNNLEGFSEEERKILYEDIERVEKLIHNIEEAINQGQIQEIFELVNEISEVYKGAPFYNILGVLEFYGGNLENAYKFFYKSALLNPLNEDVIHNLTSLANQLGKQEDVKNLFKRIFE